MSAEKQDKKRPKMDKASIGQEEEGVSDNVSGAGQIRHDDSAAPDDHDTGGTNNNIDPTENDNENQLEPLIARLDAIHLDTSNLRNQVERLKAKNRDQDTKYDLLVNTTIKKDKTINIMAGRILDLERRGMNSNIKVLNLPERPQENVKALLSDYLKGVNVDESCIDIDIAHRNGPKDKNTKRARPIIAKLNRREQVNTIIEQTKTDSFDKDAIRVTRQVPTEIRQSSAKLFHVASILKDKQPHANIMVKDGKITINGTVYKSPLAPPTLQEILQVPHEESNILLNINFYASDTYQEKGSTFRAFATPIINRQDARLAFKAISRFPGTAEATHLIAAYYDASGEFEYYDDGDFGIGRFIFDILYDANALGVMLFVAREYGGQHLGPTRFEIVQTVVDEAMNKLGAALQRNPLIADPANLQLVNHPTPQTGAQPQPSQPKPHGPDNAEQTTDEQQPQTAQPPEKDANMATGVTDMETGVDSTKHKTAYPGTPISHAPASKLDFRTPPQTRSAGNNQGDYTIVSYSKGSSDKMTKSKDESISLGKAIAGGDVFKTMMKNKTKNAKTGPKPNRGRGRGRGKQHFGQQRPAFGGLKQISNLVPTQANTKSPKRDAEGKIKADRKSVV
jgi:hypothetical protein